MRLYAFFVMFLMALRIRAYAISAPIATRRLSSRIIRPRFPFTNSTQKFPSVQFNPQDFGIAPEASFSTTFDMGSISSPSSPVQANPKVDYWNQNIPESEWTTECPDFLLGMNKKDQEILGTPQSDYSLLTWKQLSDFVADNRLDIFQRTPLDLRKYRAFNYKVIQQYGSIMNFIQTVKLKWPSPIVPKGKAFEFDEDVYVQYNDWPYGIDPEVVHLVVWTKFPLEEAGEEGDLSDAERKRIDDYVEKTFRQEKSLGAENVSLVLR